MTTTQSTMSVALGSPRRGLISDSAEPLLSPLRATAHVPGMLLDDPLFMALAGALDDALAPTVIGMDCLHYYLDPGVAPDDFLPWIGSLVGVEQSYAAGYREEIASAVPSYAHLGTADGLRAVAARAADVDIDAVTIDEPGKVTWSSQAQAVPLPAVGSPEPEPGASSQSHPTELVVTLRVTVGSHADATATANAVTAELERVRPVHCVLLVEVTS